MAGFPDFANADRPVRKSVQRLRWFVDAFQEQAARTAEETGIEFDVDQSLLAGAFSSWLRSFDAQKPTEPGRRVPFVGFAAGLMLRSLVQSGPATAGSAPQTADAGCPAEYWPEGYLYVSFCLNLRALVLQQDFEKEPPAVPKLRDARAWWSFKENVQSDPSLAIPFLDLFAGEEPDWTMPGMFEGDGTARLEASSAG